MPALLPVKMRNRDVPSHEYPNTITLGSIGVEIRRRIAEGMDSASAFLTVAEGVRNWQAQEADRSVKLTIEVTVDPELGCQAPRSSLGYAVCENLLDAPYVLTEGERWIVQDATCSSC